MKCDICGKPLQQETEKKRFKYEHTTIGGMHRYEVVVCEECYKEAVFPAILAFDETLHKIADAIEEKRDTKKEDKK